MSALVCYGGRLVPIYKVPAAHRKHVVAELDPEDFPDHVDSLADDILDDADAFEELLQTVSTNPQGREAAKEYVATSDSALAEHLRAAARDMAIEQMREEARNA